MFKVKVNGEKGVLIGKANAALIAILPSLEGRRKWMNGGLHFEATGHNLQTLQSGVGAVIERDGVVAEAFEAHAVKPEPRKTSVVRKTTPMPHQVKALEHFGRAKSMALFMEQGTGKTKTSIDWADDLYADNEITGVIVITRKGVHRQWAMGELPKHMASPYEVVFWETGKKFMRLPPRRPGFLEVITINWDGIKTEKGWDWVEEFAQRHKGKLLIIGDEAQDMKNHTSARHKAMMRLKPYSSHRAVLTGTPIAKDLTDEWAILKWLDEDILGIKYVTSFRAQYCVMGGFQNKSVVGHKEIARFRARTAPHVFRVRKQDIGLMPKQYDEWTFTMSPTQKSMIKQIKDDLLMQINGGDIQRLDHAAAALVKIQQISNGFAVDDEGVTHRLMPVEKNPRVEAALDWLRGSDSKAIIWCRFREDIFILQEALGSGFVTYMGGIKDGERQEAIDSFLNPDGAQVLLATDAASTGLNLQGLCNRALYYSEGFNAVNRWQKEDRIDRIGTVGFTVHTDLIGVGSADRHIHRNRLKKKGISDMAIEGLQDTFTESHTPGGDAMEILLSFAGDDAL